MKREPISLDKVKQIISKYSKGDIRISDYYLEKINKGKRDIEPNLIKEVLIKKDFYLCEKQIKREEIRYKIIYNLSRKYDLVIAVTEIKPKTLKIITAYKSSKKVKKKWEKSSKLVMKK